MDECLETGVFTELYGTYGGLSSIGGSTTTFLSTSSNIGGITRYDLRNWAAVNIEYSNVLCFS